LGVKKSYQEVCLLDSTEPGKTLVIARRHGFLSMVRRLALELPGEIKAEPLQASKSTAKSDLGIEWSEIESRRRGQMAGSRQTIPAMASRKNRLPRGKQQGGAETGNQR